MRFGLQSDTKMNKAGNRRSGFDLKKLLLYVTAAVVPALNVLILLWCLNHYQAHQEVETLSVLSSFAGCGVCAGIAVYAFICDSGKALIIAGLVSVIICAAVYEIAMSIPLCPLCEGLTPEDLGILAHWISCDP